MEPISNLAKITFLSNQSGARNHFEWIWEDATLGSDWPLQFKVKEANLVKVIVKAYPD